MTEQTATEQITRSPLDARRGLARFRLGLWIVLALVHVVMIVLFARAFVFREYDPVIWAVADDVYITACYARNLVEGHGPVWFPGAERVEGFTSPLWVAVLAAIHLLPFFREGALGFYVFLINVALLVYISRMFCWAIEVALRPPSAVAESDDSAAPLSGKRGLLLLVIGATIPALAYWLSEGYEVGLIAACALSGYALVLKRGDDVRTMVSVGLLSGLAMWTRMDGALYFAGAYLLIALLPTHRLRNLTVCWGTAGLMLAILILTRELYYGDFLPNTYHLKLGGWPFIDRLRRGVQQNWPLFPAVALACAPLLVPTMRQRLSGVRAPVAAALATFALSVAYSTQNGGDVGGLKLGYDRFNVTGGLFLVLALALIVARLGRTPHRRRLSFAGAWLVALLPIALTPKLGTFIRTAATLDPPRLENRWIRYGKTFERVSNPGARIILVPAGAIVYFSHRGAVDLLGKCEPFIAHQKVNLRHLPAGHNKRYTPELFRMRTPDFSQIPPPEEFSSHYQQMESRVVAGFVADAAWYDVPQHILDLGGNHFWVRRNTAHARWENLAPVE